MSDIEVQKDNSSCIMFETAGYAWFLCRFWHGALKLSFHVCIVRNSLILYLSYAHVHETKKNKSK